MKHKTEDYKLTATKYYKRYLWEVITLVYSKNKKM